jgi:FkbM family methyltransferase
MDLTMESCIAGLKARGFVPNHVFDIGGSHGPWTRMALAHWPEARFTVFEPLVEHAATLRTLESDFPQVTCFPFALGREKKQLPLSIYPEFLDTASLAYGGPGSRTVTVERLDDLLADGRTTHAQVIKIDVQGFELEVIAGAQTAIAQAEVVIVETYFFRFAPVMSLFHEMVELMRARGFIVYEIMDPLRRPYDQAVGQCDVCFVRENHALHASNRWA